MKLMERLQQSIRLAALLHNMDVLAFFLCPFFNHALPGIFFEESRIPYETDRSAPVSAPFLPRQTGAAPSHGELVIVRPSIHRSGRLSGTSEWLPRRRYRDASSLPFPK